MQKRLGTATIKCADVMHTHKYQVISIKYQTIKILEFHFTKLKHNLLDNTGVITHYLTDNYIKNAPENTKRKKSSSVTQGQLNILYFYCLVY